MAEAIGLKTIFLSLSPLILLSLLVAVKVRAQEIIDLPSMIISESATTGMRTDTPLRDIPQSIDIRDQQIIQDFGGLQRTDEIAKTVAGVNVTWQGNGGTNIPILNIRGFSNSSGFGDSDFLKDGYRKLASISNTMDLANIERIEFLKGPSSVLYGNTENLGGAINFISKRPVVGSHQQLKVTAGSDDFYRVSLDVGTALDSAEKALFRFNAAAETARSWRDFANHETQFIAPAFSYEFENGDKFTALLDYTNTRMLGDFGLPITQAYAQISSTSYFQEPDFDQTKAWAVNSLFEYEHYFGEDWLFTAGIATSWVNWSQNYTRFFSERDPVTDLFINPFTAIRQPNSEHVEQVDRNYELVLNGRISFLEMEHDLLFGSGYITHDSEINNVRTGPTYTVDLLNPDYIRQNNLGNSPTGFGNSQTDNITAFAQDLITVSPQIKLLLGVRYDTITRASQFDKFFGSTGNDKQTDSRFSPRYGIVYQPIESTSLYASFTTSFAQRINFDLDPNERYKPEISEQYEIGVKHALSPRLHATAALFQLSRKNTLIKNNDGIDSSFRQTGEQRSRGLELSLKGQVSDNIRLTSTYTWLKAEIIKDSELKPGSEKIAVPNHTFNLSGVYSFEGGLEGLELGTVLNYTSRAQVSLPNSFKLPDSFQWDILLSYQLIQKYKMQINVKNITNHRNYTVTEDFGYITIGPPRTVYATLSMGF
ncbi:MAG: TonB-dependent siderophore receptor [Methylophagaceae bacterium]